MTAELHRSPLVSRIPPLYAILDAEILKGRGLPLEQTAAEMYAAGVRLIQYRDKSGPPQDVLRAMAALRTACPEAMLILNDRADLAVLSACNGVHVGQEDLSPEDARHVVGVDRLIGVSTHTAHEVRLAASGAADYVAIGPVFATATKPDAQPVVGLDGLRRARALTAKPLVAIGGITRANAPSVKDAGADAVAVITGLFVPGTSVAQVVRDFLEILR